MAIDLYIKLPDDFAERYNDYKARILGVKQPNKYEGRDNIKNEIAEGYGLKKTEIKSQTKKDSDIIRTQTKAGLLVFNKNTGFVKLKNFKSRENLNPQGQEAKALLKLMTSKNCQVAYTDFLDKNVSKVSRRKLGFVVRNLKKFLGILPKKKTKNKDCIKNIKGYGYKLII